MLGQVSLTESTVPKDEKKAWFAQLNHVQEQIICESHFRFLWHSESGENGPSRANDYSYFISGLTVAQLSGLHHAFAGVAAVQTISNELIIMWVRKMAWVISRLSYFSQKIWTGAKGEGDSQSRRIINVYFKKPHTNGILISPTTRSLSGWFEREICLQTRSLDYCVAGGKV